MTRYIPNFGANGRLSRFKSTTISATTWTTKILQIDTKTIHSGYDRNTCWVNSLTLPSGRGFSEPSLIAFDGRFLMTLRNDDHNYLTRSDDGLQFGEPDRLKFDDASELGSYNTQTHWLTIGGRLYRVYTRRGANNDHVLRHRAPLFIGRFDTDRLCVIRDSEQILVPQRGARLGNFGITPIDEKEVWVTVTEWIQTIGPDYHDTSVCEKHGSDNSIFLANVRVD